MRFADGITVTPEVPVASERGIWGARDGIIGPDDPTISYQNNIYAFVDRAITEFFASMNPHKNNRYVYCRNNPVNFTDPLGLDEEEDDAREKAADDLDGEDPPENAQKTTVETQNEEVKGEIDAIPASQMSDSEKQAFKQHIDSLGVNEFKKFKKEWDKDPSAVIGQFKEYSGTRTTKRDGGFKGFNILVGGGGSAVAPTGGEVSGGIALNTGLGEATADLGGYVSGGAGAGVNVSADVFAGFYKGSMNDLSGDTWNINLIAGPYSLSLFFDKEKADFAGLTVGKGPSVTSIAASGVRATTGKRSIGDLMIWLADKIYGGD